MNDLIAIGRNYDIIYVICAGHFEICPIVSIVGWQNKSTIDKKPYIAEEEEVKEYIKIMLTYQKINALFCGNSSTGILQGTCSCKKTYIITKNKCFSKSKLTFCNQFRLNCKAIEILAS